RDKLVTGVQTCALPILGLTDRMDGEIRLDESDLGSEPTFRRARAGIAYVPQGREIIPDFSIRENILMGSFARADGKREIPPLVRSEERRVGKECRGRRW